MKPTRLKLLSCITGVMLLFWLGVQAADYAIQKTFFNLNAISWTTGNASNINQAIEVTQFGDFAIGVSGGLNGASAASVDVQWETSLDGSNWSTSKSALGSSGWFSVPLVNATANFAWTTNITVNSVGYWRIGWLTNASGQTITNLVVRGYVKPKRTNRDF